MSIIKKIILKEWFRFFLGATLVLIAVLSLGHILNNLLKDSLGLNIILSNLLLEIPQFLVKIFPVSCLIASLFSINKLKNRNELTAIFASGYSRRRFTLSIGIFGTLVGVSLFFINSYLVPYTKHIQLSSKDMHSLTSKNFRKKSISINEKNSGRIWFKGQDYFFSYSSFDRMSKTLYNLNLYYYNDDFKFTEQYSAQYAEYLSANRWKLHQVIHYTNLDLNDFPSIKSFNEAEINLKETIDDFKSINANIITLNVWKLYDYISVLRSNGLNINEYYVVFLDKFAGALTCIVLSVLASIAIFNPNRRSSSFGQNVSFVLAFTFAYWFIYSYFLSLGEASRIPAEVATFGVPFLFIFYLIFYFIYHRKLR